MQHPRILHMGAHLDGSNESEVAAAGHSRRKHQNHGSAPLWVQKYGLRGHLEPQQLEILWCGSICGHCKCQLVQSWTGDWQNFMNLQLFQRPCV